MNLFVKIKESIIKFSQKHEIADIQNWGGTLATGFSALAFTGSVLLNKGIPGEQKEFLASQELADGAISVTLFWFMTDRFKKGAEKLIKEGKIFPKSAKEEVEKVKKELSENASWNEIKSKLSKQKIEEIDKFHLGFKNTISLSGTLLATCIITPIVRNIIASKIQKSSKGNVFDKNTSLQSIPKTQEKPQNPVKVQTFQSRSGLRV